LYDGDGDPPLTAWHRSMSVRRGDDAYLVHALFGPARRLPRATSSCPRPNDSHALSSWNRRIVWTPSHSTRWD